MKQGYEIPSISVSCTYSIGTAYVIEGETHLHVSSCSSVQTHSTKEIFIEGAFSQKSLIMAVVIRIL